MKCKNCGVEIANNSKYCPRCGTVFENDDIKRMGNTLESRLLNVYTKEKKFNFFNISFGYLFFNFLYLFYKKMYYEGLLSIFSLLVIYYMIFLSRGTEIVFNSLGFYTLFVIFILMLAFYLFFYYLFKTNDLYITNVKYRINKLIKNNPDRSEEELFNLCKKDSKGNIWLPILGALIFAFLLYILKN